MKRFPREVYLPRTGNQDFDTDLLETFAEVAQTVEWIQTPPVLLADLANIDQVIPVGVATALDFLQSTDTHGWFDDAMHRYTPKETGYYQVSLQVTLEYTGGLSNAGNIRIGLLLNDGNIATMRADPEGSGTVRRTYTIAKLVKMNGVDEYLSASVNYDTGSGLTVLGAIARTYLTVHWVGGDQLSPYLVQVADV